MEAASFLTGIYKTFNVLPPQKNVRALWRAYLRASPMHRCTAKVRAVLWSLTSAGFIEEYELWVPDCADLLIRNSPHEM